MTAAPAVHGTGLVLGGHGLLLRGPSGAGKSLLALWLMEQDATARLVGDDGVILEPAGNGIVMRAPERIAGLIELRGRGIIERPHVAAARLDLVVDLVAEIERMPEETAFRTRIEGVSVARCPVPRAGLAPMEHQILLIRDAIGRLGAEKPVSRQKDT